MGFPNDLRDLPYCYLTTTGRKSGLPREIEIWFAARGSVLFLMAGAGERAHWVRNLRRNSSVHVRVAERRWEAWGHVVTNADDDAWARAALVGKYQPGYGRSLEEWGRTALPVAIELWEPLTPQLVAALMSGLEAPWRIVGGYALDAFAGRSWGEHEDVDVAFSRPDQSAVRSHLDAWDLHAVEPPETLRPWSSGETLPAVVYNIWGRREPDEAWSLQLLIDDTDGEDWVFRRDPRVRRPLAGLTFEREGIRYLVPEVQLLFKSRARRPKDETDFAVCLPLLEPAARRWLADALLLTDPSNPWFERL